MNHLPEVKRATLRRASQEPADVARATVAPAGVVRGVGEGAAPAPGRWPPWAALLLGVALAGCGQPAAAAPEAASPPAAGPTHPVAIHVPAGLGTMQTDLVDLHGHPVEVTCGACHGVLPPIGAMKAPDKRTFHQTHVLAHGALQCRACHNPPNMDVLHLADGATVPFGEVVTLCGQCHGSQKRDFDHGAHGGMNGHWDLTRGPRVRSACVVCHDPHAPKIPQVWPARGPQDRFLTAERGGDHD